MLIKKNASQEGLNGADDGMFMHSLHTIECIQGEPEEVWLIFYLNSTDRTLSNEKIDRYKYIKIDKVNSENRP